MQSTTDYSAYAIYYLEHQMYSFSMILNTITLQTPYLSLDSEFYDLVDPTPLDEPYLISFNPDAAKLIDLDSNSCDNPDFIGMLNGTFVPEGSRPFAMCYAVINLVIIITGLVMDELSIWEEFRAGIYS